METRSELSVMLHSIKLEKKWLMIGGSIGLASLLGVSYWVYQKYNIKKEEMVADFLNKIRVNAERSLIVKPKETKQKNSCEEIEKKIIKDFNNSVAKFIYRGNKLEKLLTKVNADKDYAKDFGRRFYELFAELLNQFLKFIQESIKNKTLSTHSWVIDKIFEVIFDQFLLQLKYSTQYDCELLKGLVARMFNHMIISDLLHLRLDYKSAAPPSQADQKFETSYFEMIIRYTRLMSVKTQEKFLSILQNLISYDSRLLHFLQLCLAKNIYFVSSIDTNHSQSLQELTQSRHKEETYNHQTMTFNNNSSSIHLHHRPELNQSFQQNQMNGNTRGGPNSSSQTQGGIKTQSSFSHSMQNESRKKVIPSPLCKILSNGIAPNCAQQMIQEGFAYTIIENMCELVQKSSSDLIDLERVISNLYKIVSNIIENRQNNQKLFNEYYNLIIDILLKSLTYSETNKTTTVSNSNIVDLVNWMTYNLDIILIRAKCTTMIQKILTQFLSINKALIPEVGPIYLQEVRYIHKMRREDQLKGFMQLETDLSTTNFFLHILLNSMSEIPHQKSIIDYFINSFPFADDQERFYIIKSFTSLLQNYVFMKELYISMLEKSCTQTNHLILTFTEFKNFFYSPEGKKYDEILLSLQFMILLGGGDSLCDTIVERWEKDAQEYENFKIYMSSDIAFLLQLLENDTCYLNVNSNWQESLSSYESKANYRFHAYIKIFVSAEKDTIKDSLKHQIAASILDSDNIFESALEEVARQCFQTNQGNGQSLYYSNHSSHSQNHHHHHHHSNIYTTKYELKEAYSNKYFHSLFNRDIHLLIKLLNQIQSNQQNSLTLNQHDLHIESTLNERDEPLLYLKQVRRVLLENINLHTAFRQIFIENIPILLEKLRVVCRILNYIFDVIEEGILDCRASKRLSKDSIKSLLVKYIFDPVLAEKIQFVTELTDEEGELLAIQFIPTLQNLSYRRDAIKDLIKDIFKGQNISDIIV